MEQIQHQVNTLLRTRRQRRVRLLSLSAAALLAVLGVAYGLRQYGVAKTAPEKVLACRYEAPQGPGYAGFSLHSHTEDCFDADGVKLEPSDVRTREQQAADDDRRILGELPPHWGVFQERA